MRRREEKIKKRNGAKVSVKKIHKLALLPFGAEERFFIMERKEKKKNHFDQKLSLCTVQYNAYFCKD